MHERYYLGIDWGAAKVGVALADPETRVALALTTLPNDADLVENVKRIIQQEQVGTVVIGVPLYSHVRQGVHGGTVFGAQLAKACADTVAVVYYNEMFTTKLAQRNLIERGLSAVGKQDDAESARILLADWLAQKQGGI